MAAIAVVFVVAGATTSAGAATDRPAEPTAPPAGVLLADTAPRPAGDAVDKLERDHPHVDYVRLVPGDLVQELVASIQPDEVDPDTSCQALRPRDRTVAVDGRSIDFTGVEATVCDPGEGSYLSWHGQVATADGDVLASASLAVIFDDDGTATGATGTIQDGSTTGYELMPVEGDTYSLSELASSMSGDEAGVSGEGEPGSSEVPASTTTEAVATTSTTTTSTTAISTSTTGVAGDMIPGGDAQQPVAEPPEDRSGLATDDAQGKAPSEVDGGQPRTGGPTGNRTIQVRFAYANGITYSQAYLYMVNRTDQTNDSFITSNMPVRIEGVGPVPANYTQSPSIPIDLNNLADPSGGGMDPLLASFNSSTMDALAVLVPDARVSCGTGNLSSEVTASAPFLSVSAVASGCDFTVTHELGHNFTAHHNPEDASPNTAFPWSYGHYVSGKKRDVMSYDSPCGSPCPRVLQWSDPDNSFIGFPGTPSGTPTRDNDRSVTDASWAASQKGNSSSNDSIWYRSASGHAGFSVPNDIEAPYTPLSGDFNGDGNADQFWYFPGRPIERLWTFSATTGSYSAHDLNVVGDYQPATGDFDGDGRDDIFWHGGGGDPDSIWWGTANSNDLGTVVTTATVGGTYVPQAGDVDGDGKDDIVWYAPGTAGDHIWWGNASRPTFAGGSGSTAITVNGTYLLTLGDYDGDGRDDLSWFLPGTGSDFLWKGMASHSAVGPGNQTSYTVNGQRIPKSGDFDGDGKDDIFWYGPGSEPESIWWGQSTMAAFASGASWTSQSVGGTYLPTTGDFNGDTFTDIFWFSFG